MDKARGQTVAKLTTQAKKADIAATLSIMECNDSERDLNIALAKLRHIDLERERRKDAFDESQDYRNGYIAFASAIDGDGALALTTTLRRLDRMFPKQDITIELCSPGGQIAPGFIMFDEILRMRGLGHKITIRVRGEACSMAAVLLQAATVREMGPNARLMLHRASFGIQGSAAEVEDSLEETKQLEEQIYAILSSRSGKTAAWWRKTLAGRKDVWYRADQAVAVGLVDAVG